MFLLRLRRFIPLQFLPFASFLPTAYFAYYGTQATLQLFYSLSGTSFFSCIDGRTKWNYFHNNRVLQPLLWFPGYFSTIPLRVLPTTNIHFFLIGEQKLDICCNTSKTYCNSIWYYNSFCTPGCNIMCLHSFLQQFTALPVYPAT